MNNLELNLLALPPAPLIIPSTKNYQKPWMLIPVLRTPIIHGSEGLMKIIMVLFDNTWPKINHWIK